MYSKVMTMSMMIMWIIISAYTYRYHAISIIFSYIRKLNLLDSNYQYLLFHSLKIHIYTINICNFIN